MDTNNWRLAPQGGEPVMDAGDWRNQLPPESRQRIVNKMYVSFSFFPCHNLLLKKHSQFCNVHWIPYAIVVICMVNEVLTNKQEREKG